MQRSYTFAALLAAALTLPAAAQEGEPIDEISVVGQKSMTQLRNEVFEAEEAFYSVYNALNDDDEYDVTCFYETPTGTRIKNHVCRAKFVSRAYAAQSSKGRGDVTRIANQDADSAFTEKTKIFEQKLETLIAENENLQAALVRYNTARADFSAARERE